MPPDPLIMAVAPSLCFERTAGAVERHRGKPGGLVRLPATRRARWGQPGALRLAGQRALLLAAGALGGLALLTAIDQRYVASIQRDLDATPSAGRAFSPGMVAELPEPARRYFRHAIRPGTPLATRVHLSQAGSLRLGARWAPFSAEQVLTPCGFVWRATSRLGPLRITATDHLAGGRGRMRIAAFGLVPLVNEAGSALSRSAAGRLVVEYMWLPSACLPGLSPGVTVDPVDADRFAVTVAIGGEATGEATRLIQTVDRDGRLTESALLRFGNQTPDRRFRYIPFGGLVDEEGTFGGYTIPTRIRAGWWYGTAQYQEAFRFQITAAAFA
jgi:hypothetical protein